MNLAILQARSSSTRFPNKVLSDLAGMPMIIRQINRLKLSKKIDELVVATSVQSSDDELVSVLENFEVKVYRGDLNNVASRFLELIKIYQPTNVIRLTADCPLTDVGVIDSVIKAHINSGAGYTSNTLTPTFPDGLDVECFLPELLVKLIESEPSDTELEHVTYGLYTRHGFCKVNSVEQNPDLSHLRWTVDIPEDLDFVRKIYEFFPENPDKFDQNEIIEVLKNNPELNRTSDSLERNSGLNKQSEK